MNTLELGPLELLGLEADLGGNQTGSRRRRDIIHVWAPPSCAPRTIPIAAAASTSLPPPGRWWVPHRKPTMPHNMAKRFSVRFQFSVTSTPQMMAAAA